MKKLSLVLAMVLMLGGCATTHTPLSTPTGRPELIFNMDKSRAMNLVLKEALESGWKLGSSSDFSLVLLKPVTSQTAELLLGLCDIRAKFNFVVMDEKTVKAFISTDIVSRGTDKVVMEIPQGPQGGGETDKLLIRIQEAIK